MTLGVDGRLHIRPSIRFSLLPLLHYLTLFSLVASAAAAPGFWSNIYDAPTPSAEDSPPASRHASRNKRLLPYQICGILGGYVVFVLVSLILLLTIGRRLRRAAEMSPASLEIELIPQGNKGFIEETPISPASTTRSWFKGAFKKSSSVKGESAPTSPGGFSVGSFDQSVIDNDKDARQKEMERLYAAVMEHDARKSQSSNLAVENVEDDEEIQPTSPARGEKRPPRLLMKSQDGIPATPRSPTSPIKPIYPPMSPRSINTTTTRSSLASQLSPRTVPLPMSPGKSPSSPRSIFSSLGGGRTRKALKNLRISGPIKDYPGANQQDEARVPLSPRLYPNMPPPPVPPSEEVDRSVNSTPRTAYTTDGEYAYEELDQPQPLPMPRGNPLRGPLSPGFQPPQQSANPSIMVGSPKSTTSSNSSLPLRSYATADTAVPPTPTKVTYLERKRDQLSLMTPRTGVPSTPYSPYMPFTPITPVTPHLVSKKEMKSRKKVEGRRILSDHDLVRDDKDLWDSGY